MKAFMIGDTSYFGDENYFALPTPQYVPFEAYIARYKKEYPNAKPIYVPNHAWHKALSGRCTKAELFAAMIAGDM